MILLKFHLSSYMWEWRERRRRKEKKERKKGNNKYLNQLKVPAKKGAKGYD